MSAPERRIHATAIIDPDARLADDVEVGPWCRIGGQVRIGTGCCLDSHVVIGGPSEIGAGNRFFPFSTIGLDPQDLKYGGEPTRLHIGSGNTIREYVSIHRGTVEGGGETRIGDRNLLMAGAHVAHDCTLGNDIIMANAATLAGHVVIEDHATIGAFSGVHQFCRIGCHGYVGGYSVITKDVLPYSKTVSRRETRVYGVNTIGLERKGFDRDRIATIERVFRLLGRSGLNTSQALEAIRQESESADGHLIVEFIETSSRGIYR
jgi:UDP-N-acetylglucosamine acyltransferase